MNDKKPYVSIEHLKTYFDVTHGAFAPKQIVKAVDDVSLDIYPGETLGLVGESGCGKSSLGRTIVKINRPTSGTIKVDGRDIANMRGDELRQFRRNVQMIFQDPYASLDPRMTVGEIIREPMNVHHIYHTRAEQDARVVELLRIVGLKPDHIRRYPHEFSGGQRQRISIARTLALNPKFIICDEPISALDVSIQAQIINMLMDLQQQLGMAYLFIAHDLAVVRHISQHVVVMYLGHVMEINESEDLYRHPLHPYTRALLSAIPVPDPKTSRTRQREILQGDVPSPINPPKGCVFCTRCRYATDECRSVPPKLEEVEPGHKVACHHFREID